MTQNVALCPEKKGLILLADDDRFITSFMEVLLKKLGYTVHITEDGQSTLDFIMSRCDEIDAVLLDRRMPEISGLEIVSFMQKDQRLKSLPVIMQTGADRPEEIQQGIDAGVFYYLTKPVNPDVLKSVLSAAVREVYQKRLLAKELQRQGASFGFIDMCVFHCRTLTEAEQLAAFLANCYPDRDRVVAGLAELLINAVEHGNCGIGYDEKGKLVEEGIWREEVLRRAELPENKYKKVEVTFRREARGLTVTIRDQGKGFEWKNYLQIDPARAADNHGRGIAQANMISFDGIVFNEIGNEVSAFVGLEKPLEW